MAVDGIRICHEFLPTFFQGSLGPCLESCPCSGNRLVDILLGRNGDFRIGLGRGRVDVMAAFRSLGQFVIDQIVVCLANQLFGSRRIIPPARTSNSSFGLCPLARLETPLEIAEGAMTIIWLLRKITGVLQYVKSLVGG